MTVDDKRAGANQNSSNDLLIQRFLKDLGEVLEYFELGENAMVSEVTVSQVMQALGFINFHNEAHIEAVSAIWFHLQPVGGHHAAEKQVDENGNEIEDNGERVAVAHLKVYLGAILGF